MSILSKNTVLYSIKIRLLLLFENEVYEQAIISKDHSILSMGIKF